MAWTLDDVVAYDLRPTIVGHSIVAAITNTKICISVQRLEGKVQLKAGFWSIRYDWLQRLPIRVDPKYVKRQGIKNLLSQ